ncbi:hypothetical protein ACE7GA_22805 [Roseomonas sp. CCTCC AB2023176]|uniref:hypothetical protein n=1 Tax=Roseomonas sp. CCTCC AB2023176 TaxID=3342640 RepID=UPI0035E23C0C
MPGATAHSLGVILMIATLSATGGAAVAEGQPARQATGPSRAPAPSGTATEVGDAAAEVLRARGTPSGRAAAASRGASDPAPVPRNPQGR